MASDVTLLLERYKQGEAGAFDALAQLIYPQLKVMAQRRTRGPGGLGATTLVNETFLKLLSGGELKLEDRQQFFGLAASIMRQVIVDEVRYVTAQKRRGSEQTFSDTQVADPAQEQADFLLQVDQILERLEAQDSQLARVFECRYFAGFTTAETAEALGVSNRSVDRLWATARERIAALMSDSTR
jgi:RNA polymerase sigma factor (TIGR02999 family)